ncbi:MAG: hypothetical protein HOO97_00780 [Sideroxydans sp.]|nr:hypothetical protein [Sideroxydans sp.]
MERKFSQVAKLLMGIAVMASPFAHADEDSYLTLSSGFDYSSGKYGTASVTDTLSVPISALYEKGAWSLKLTVPFLMVTGAGDVMVSGRNGGKRRTTTTTTTTVTKTITTQTGLGDVVTMATYNLYSSDESDSGIDLTGRIKFGTASKAFGSGLNDYSAQMVAYTSVGNLAPSASLGYEVVGSSTTAPMNNVYFGSIGAGYRLGEQTRIGIDCRYAQKASATGAEQKDVSLYASQELTPDVYLRGYVLKGFAAGSADTGLGMSISTTF